MNTPQISFRFRWALVAGMGLFLTLASCNKDDDDPVDCTGITPTYTGEVKAILDASCALSGCHDAVTAQSGVNLSTYAAASAISQETRFVAVIQHRNGFTPMPFGGSKLPEETIQTLVCWVENGSPQ